MIEKGSGCQRYRDGRAGPANDGQHREYETNGRNLRAVLECLIYGLPPRHKGWAASCLPGQRSWEEFLTSAEWLILKQANLPLRSGFELFRVNIETNIC